jgi:hypothetical protein
MGMVVSKPARATVCVNAGCRYALEGFRECTDGCVEWLTRKR